MNRRPNVVVIGAGRAGLGLARALRDAGYKVPAIVTRRRAQASAVGRLLGRGSGTTELPRAVSRAGIVLVCVPDREIPAVVRQLASLPATDLKGRVILHTSGVSSAEPLAMLRKHGASAGSFHPLVSFPPPPGQRGLLAGAAFAIDGDPRALRTSGSLARALGGIPIRIAPQDRAAYHLIASLLANGLVALLDEGFGLARRRLAMTDTRVRAVFIPLLATVLTNVARTGTGQALTGPVVRGDSGTVGRHLEQLRGEAPELAGLYRLLARSALRMALDTHRIDGAAADEIERVLTRD